MNHEDFKDSRLPYTIRNLSEAHRIKQDNETTFSAAVQIGFTELDQGEGISIEEAERRIFRSASTQL